MKQLTAKTKTGIEIEVSITTRKGYGKLEPAYLAHLNGATSPASLQFVSRVWCVELQEPGNLFPGMTGKPLVKLNHTEKEVFAFQREARKFAEAETVRYAEDVLANIDDAKEIQLVITTTSFGLVLISRDMDDLALKTITPDILRAEKEGLLNFVRDDGYDFHLTAQVTWAEIRVIVEKLRAERQAVADAEAVERAAKFEEARRTGQPVVLSKIVLPEEDTPLRNDGENDMVDVVTYAMPDGTTKTKYFHNY